MRCEGVPLVTPHPHPTPQSPTVNPFPLHHHPPQTCRRLSPSQRYTNKTKDQRNCIGGGGGGVGGALLGGRGWRGQELLETRGKPERVGVGGRGRGVGRVWVGNLQREEGGRTPEIQICWSLACSVCVRVRVRMRARVCGTRSSHSHSSYLFFWCLCPPPPILLRATPPL